MSIIIKIEYKPFMGDIRDNIIQCQKGSHVQQVAYSTYHDGLTQICFTCKMVRTNINEVM